MQRRGTGVGAALHVAAAGEGDDLVPGDAEVGGGLRGGGRRGVGALLGGLVGGLRGLVLVERDRRGGVRGVDVGLGRVSWPASCPIRSATASAAASAAAIWLLLGAAAATGRRQPDREGDGDRRPRQRRASSARAPGTAVHVPTSSAVRPRGARRSTQTAPGGAPL